MIEHDIRRITEMDTLVIEQLGTELFCWAEEHGYTEDQFDNTILRLAAFHLSRIPKPMRKMMLRQIKEAAKIRG